MALRNKSLFNYDLTVTAQNQFISFGTSPSETPPSARTATLQLGFYSLTSLAAEIARALTSADPLHVYTVTVNRNVAGGLENRFTITSSFSYFSIYFGTGNPANPASLIGFNTADYTGSTSYTGSASAGTAFVPNLTLTNNQVTGFTYLPPWSMQKLQGQVNVSASGIKEAITFTIMQFWQVQFKYISEDSLITDWNPFVQWLIQQRAIEFTPDITDPDTFFAGTLDDPSKGLEFNFTEMLPNFPFNYSTPLMKFRLSNT